MKPYGLVCKMQDLEKKHTRENVTENQLFDLFFC